MSTDLPLALHLNLADSKAWDLNLDTPDLRYRYPFGQLVPEPVPTLQFSATIRADYTAYANMVIVSGEIADIIVGFGGEVQLLPVDLRVSNQCARHFILNVLHECACFDRVASEFSERRGSICRIARLRIDRSRLDGAPIFILPDCDVQVIFFRSDLAAAIEAKKRTGGELLKVEDWYTFGVNPTS